MTKRRGRPVGYKMKRSSKRKTSASMKGRAKSPQHKARIAHTMKSHGEMEALYKQAGLEREDGDDAMTPGGFSIGEKRCAIAMGLDLDFDAPRGYMRNDDMPRTNAQKAKWHKEHINVNVE